MSITADGTSIVTKYQVWGIQLYNLLPLLSPRVRFLEFNKKRVAAHLPPSCHSCHREILMRRGENKIRGRVLKKRQHV